MAIATIVSYVLFDLRYNSQQLSNINDILGIKYLLYLFISLTIHSKVSFVLPAFLNNDFVGTSCEGTLAGLFIIINSLLLIVVNNPA